MIRTVILMLTLSAPVLAQQQQAIDAYLKANELENLLKQKPGQRDRFDLQNLLPERRSNDFLSYLEATSYKGLIDAVDAARLNKFAAAAGGSGGSTALLSKVAVPAVLGLGVEYGSILQQTEGMATTLRGNLLGLGRWGLGSQQFQYCPEIAQDTCSASEQFLRRFSVATTFENVRKQDETVTVATAGGPAVADLFTQDFRMSAWGLRFDLTRNNLDDPKYITKWREQIAKLRGDQTADQLTLAVAGAFKGATSEEYLQWRGDILTAINNAVDEREIKAILTRQLDAVVPILERANPTQADALRTLRRAYSNYFLVRDGLLREAQVHKMSLEYVNSHPQNQPNRSSVRFIYSHQPSSAPAVITLNMALTMYNALQTGASHRLRDVQVAAQLDRSLGDIGSFGRASLALAGYYQWMKDDALISIGPGNIAPGSGIVLSQPAVKLLGTKGSIGVFQGKLSLPLGQTMKVPLSVTWANRTELINEKEVRGQIGVTLDMDSLFR